jgi:predicted GNAT superfamily acetyltransferase
MGLGADSPLLLVEIPSDFLALKQADPNLASAWRFHTRTLFEDLFQRGYLVTDFIFLPGRHPRSYYVLSHGDSTL